MFEDLRNRLGKARNAYIERQGEVNRVLAESKTRFKAEREAEERLREEEQRLTTEWLPTIEISPRSIEDYSRLYGPVEEIPLRCPNKGIWIHQAIYDKRVFYFQQGVSIAELKEQGLVAIVETCVGRSQAYESYWGTPVRKASVET